MPNLTTLANKFGTDKGTQAKAAHGYSLIYEMFFASMRGLPRVDILEMGLAIGGPELGGDIDRDVAGSPSIDTWIQFFDNAHIVGFDISDFSTIQHDRFRFVRGDSGKRQDVEKILALDQKFDVIIDDASHASFHQQLGLAVLFEQLKPGGLYVIEDLSWQPSTMERDLPRVPKTAHLLSDFVTSGVFSQTAAISADVAHSLQKMVGGVCFFDESLLNSLGNSYNRRFGLPSAQRGGWRGRSLGGRVASLHFWLFNLRRLGQSLTGAEFANHQSVKMAILQRLSD